MLRAELSMISARWTLQRRRAVTWQHCREFRDKVDVHLDVSQANKVAPVSQCPSSLVPTPREG
jgi:hypothetical protein